jgi:iron complex outermembrane recepter protein
MPNKCKLYFGASLVTFALYSTSAYAAGQAAPMPAANASDQQDSSTTSLQDIVVTAQRRQQNQQDVPISITAVTSDVMAKSGVTNTEALSNIVPALQFSRQSTLGGAPFIRGVGTSAVPIGVEPAVATYVDDVYIGSALSTTTGLNNIDHVEVLKGPQGTLFGRNATGGVVSIQTRKPSQDPAYEATVGYGNYNTLDLNAYVNQPLTNTLAVNISAARHKQADGYGLDVNTGDDIYLETTWGVRGEVLWKPDDRTSALFIGDYYHYKGDTGQNVTVLPGTISNGGTAFPGRYRGTAVPLENAETSQYGFSLKVEHDFDIFRVVSISAYRADKNFTYQDLDAAPVRLLDVSGNQRTKTFSEELRILSPAESKLQWIGGLMYYHSNANYGPGILTGSALAAIGGSQTVSGTQKLDAYAGFGEINFNIFDNTRLTAGARYSSDHFRLINAGSVNFAGAYFPGGPVNVHDTFSKLTYRVVLDHHFTPGIMAYASVSRGFKSGGYNIQTPTVTVGGVVQPAPPVTPEVLDAYEIGTKMELFDRKLRINPSIFYYKYKNMQVSTIQNNAVTILNAASAEIKGIDIDFEARVNRRIKLSGGIGVLDSEFTSFPAGPLYVPRPATCTPTPRTTGPITGGNIACSADLTGNRTTRAPKFTGSVNASYAIPTDIGAFEVSGSFYHNSGFFWEADNRTRQPSYNLVGAVLSWTSSNDHYRASLWAKNLTNAYYYTFVSEGTNKDSGSPALPRTYGASFGVKF